MKILVVVWIHLLLASIDDCPIARFLHPYNQTRINHGILELKNEKFLALVDDGQSVVFYFTNDTIGIWAFRELPPEHSDYYDFKPYHKFKAITIDTANCMMKEEMDVFIRPVTSHIYARLTIEYQYEEGIPQSSETWNARYSISFTKPFHYTSAHSIPKPEGWFELNVDSLFLENRSPSDGTIFDDSYDIAYKNDILFGRYISRHRHRNKELTIHQADSILQSWGFEGFNENAFKQSEVMECN